MEYQEYGSRVEGDLVNGQFVKHFQNFLGTTYHVLPLSTMGNIVKLKLSEAEALDMIKEVSDIEIKEALFDIDSSKAAGPDGYTSCFFKKAWGVIGADICLAIRPIACCNVLYKCISKILTNRIKDGLSKVVSLTQSAFIPERHIQDNILITHELLIGYNRKNGAKRYAMKIDIHKAYDTISWDFLREVMLMVGFHDTMVHWIMTCITSASFSICANGEINGFFKGGRGLRQGDPISPYLFTLVMEVFNMIMIKNISESGKFKYHCGCKELKLTHMCFVDDLMVLCNGDIESLKVVKKSLDDFSDVSGLFPNLSKSTIFFGSISETLKEDMLRLLTFKCGKLPMKITCWRNTFLSYAGRIQLIASVLSAMHQYWAFVYMIPASVTNEHEKIFKRFLWNFGGSAKGKAKLIDKKESMWVKWVSTVKLKGNSIWEAEIDNIDSHGWKELIRIRYKIKPYVIFKIKDGKYISVWHDKWCDQDPLDRFIQNMDIYDVRMSNEDCLVDAIVEGRWKWADEWSSRFLELCQIDVLLLSHKRDKAVWICKGNKIVNFTTRNAWLTLRDVWPKLDCMHCVLKAITMDRTLYLGVVLGRRFIWFPQVLRWPRGSALLLIPYVSYTG
nr:hypothetical protein [Tanacetum cinerariifolium]